MRISFPTDVKAWPPVVEEADGTMSIVLGKALLSACEEVNKAKVTFYSNPEISGPIWSRFGSHPDRSVSELWLAKVKPGEEEIFVVICLCCHVAAEWAAIPKRTVKEHRLFNEIEGAIAHLLQLINKTGSRYYRGGGHGLQNARVSELLLPAEEAAILGPLIKVRHPENEGDPAYDFPTMEELLTRLSAAAKRLAEAGPIHSQPNKRGADRGFFVRRMHELLTQRYGEAPHEVLAALTTIAMDEVTDRELVAKLLK